MTPSNANTSGLDCVRIIACHLPEAHCPDTVCLPITITAGDLRAVYAVLVTAASAQARIAELEESDKNGRENWDGVIDPISSYASVQDDYGPILDAAPAGGPDVVGQTFIALLEARKDRATAAEARADRLSEIASKLDAAISWLDYPFIDNRTPEAELRQRVGFMMTDAEPYRAALQQEG